MRIIGVMGILAAFLLAVLSLSLVMDLQSGLADAMEGPLARVALLSVEMWAGIIGLLLLGLVGGAAFLWVHNGR